ncbi:BESS motif [Popillia japonica]|uniref:BESS motif n=1 Tax=Popillia japonica TaxID=7064 RepID=A0AAW1MHE0_POPJA
MFFLKATLTPRSTSSNYEQRSVHSVENNVGDSSAQEHTATSSDSLLTEAAQIEQNSEIVFQNSHDNHDMFESQTEQEPEEIADNSVGKETNQNNSVNLQFPKNTTTRKRKLTTLTTFEKHMLDTENKKVSTLSKIQDNENEDMLFLRSLLPFFHELPPIRKLIVRNKIQTIFINEFTTNSIQVQHSSSESSYTPSAYPSPVLPSSYNNYYSNDINDL